MDIVLVTGSAGLVGAESVRFFCEKGFMVVGIDNDLRGEFFGSEASTAWAAKQLSETIEHYHHHDIDIRDRSALDRVFEEHGKDIKLVVHAAAQPAHDWAAGDPLTDFSVNATGTLNVLEATRQHCGDAVFIFTSTNKVYGDVTNTLPLVERETRWELPEDHAYFDGITEALSIDQATHSLFGASKIAADIMVQEYGHYFGMKTASFRAGCVTGPGHAATEQHGFLAYLMKCCMRGTPYTVFGHHGKQVRDNIHCHDLVEAFYRFYRDPRKGEVYNIGGGRFSNVSMHEAIALCESIAGKKMNTVYNEQPRTGDHIWWISGLQKFRNDYPHWQLTYDTQAILEEIYQANLERAKA
ncbi:MAG: NAD-dependent epimerase/dehydratase family protein [Candidatus Hydrogenedentes bacterium]|nr:NAD-dependent epimerase/dehydratase family protein [Candidatus Hydrogenedentota bacterium]